MTRDELLPHLMDALAEAELTIAPQKVLTLADQLAPRLPVSTKAPRQKWSAWTEQQEADLTRMYSVEDVPTPKICEHLGMSTGAVKGAISRLKLRRPPGTVGKGRRPHNTLLPVDPGEPWSDTRIRDEVRRWRSHGLTDDQILQGLAGITLVEVATAEQRHRIGGEVARGEIT